MPHPLLDGFPIALSIPVQWGEMDAYGHVNNTVFFRWFEAARIDYLIRCGFAESKTRDDVGAILHSTSCRFRRPVHHPDTIEVGGRAGEVAGDRFTMEYRVVSHSQDAVVAEGAGVIVAFDYGARRKAPLPEAVRRGIAALEHAAGGGPP